MAVYALTIFLGAFLLFQVQPLIGKFILPWFGGGTSVWTTCLLFFQAMLLCGYGYAHFTSRRLKPRVQVCVHLVLLVLALAFLPIVPGESWKPQAAGNPTWQILEVLAVCLGVQYFVLSATGPLLQHWFSRSNPGLSPYRLYAASNLGSLLALVSYPLWFETHFTRRTQALWWSVALVVFAVGCGVCALQQLTMRPVMADMTAAREPERAPSLPQRLLWLILPACASILLLATTNKICQDIAVAPFLWVVPLALYLLSFIICFDNPRWYLRPFWGIALIGALAGICWAFYQGREVTLWQQVGVFSAAMFCCCMVCHGELFRLRPAPQRLTSYYLNIAAGGALGGVFVAVIAPLIFNGYYELQYGVVFCALLFALICALERNTITEGQWRWFGGALSLAAFLVLDWALRSLADSSESVSKGRFTLARVGMWTLLALLAASWTFRKRRRAVRPWRPLACAWLFLTVVGLSIALWINAVEIDPDTVFTTRDFYGVLTLLEHRREDPASHYFVLRHGRITHGLQLVEPSKATLPTSYYSARSGVGLAIQAFPPGGRRIGIVGLGAGTLTAYAHPGDYFRIYEINPTVQRIATDRFTYLGRCAGKVDVVLGDARLSLEREPPQHFDLLVLDAFNGDAIPVHLLTREAFEIYCRHLNTNGVIAVHISNHYLNLQPVVANAAKRFGFQRVLVDQDENPTEWWAYGSTWYLLSRSAEILNSPAIRGAASAEDARADVPLWTDDYSSLLPILKTRR